MPRTVEFGDANDPVLDLALDTIQKRKQALVFCNTKKGAESQAERIAQKVTTAREEYSQLAQQALDVLSSPTKQCQRLAACLRKGIAFHHAGLHSQQRTLIEDAFRDGRITVICATPTLAMGMDLPAWRSIIRDLKRYSSGTSWGMADIPVLEYEQMAGRAGRPGKETSGEAICIAASEGDRDRIVAKYLLGDPESISSKLAVEPVLRMHILSLVASGYVRDVASLDSFFSKTFYAHQYGDMERLSGILRKMTDLLRAWGFLVKGAESGDFVSADALAGDTLQATPLGERVAQLYLDPLTANHLVETLHKAAKRGLDLKDVPLLHLLSTTLEIRPLPSLRKADYPALEETLVEHEDDLLVTPPTIYSYEYEEFLQSIKLTRALADWIDEKGEDHLHEQHNLSPGDLHAKLQILEWLLYSTIELCKLQGMQHHIAPLERMRVRLEYGVREELLTLLRLTGIGRVRARKLYVNGIKNLADAKAAETSKLRSLLGEKLAVDVKKQLGQEVEAVKPNKRKGQIGLGDYAS